MCRWKYSISQGHRTDACPPTPTKHYEQIPFIMEMLRMKPGLEETLVPLPQHAVATSAVAAPAAKHVPPPAKRAPSPKPHVPLPQHAVATSAVAAPAAKHVPPPAKRAPSPEPHDCPHHTTCVAGKCTECACAACTATQAVPG